MKNSLAALVGILIAASHAEAASPSALRPVGSSEVTIRFVPAENVSDLHETVSGEALVELGSLSAFRQPLEWDARRQSATIRRRVTVDLQSRSSLARFATVRAFLATDDGRSRVRVDGIPLSSTPQLIEARARLGSATTHTIEIEIPASMPAGPLFSSITWIVETD